MLFCRGDGARMDAQINRLATLLAVQPRPAKLPVYVVGYHESNLIEEWCFGSATIDKTLGGCFQDWMVVTQPPWTTHELNHAVLHALNPSVDSAFWLKAYASTWEPEASSGEHVDRLAMQDVTGAYTQGRHFMRWLIAVRGIAQVVSFYESFETGWSETDVEEAFAAAFEVGFEELLAEYQTEVPLAYPGDAWCDDIESIDVPVGQTQFTLELDCDKPDTHAFYSLYPFDGMYVRRVLRLEQPLDLEIQYSSHTGILRRHPCLETPVVSAEDPRLDQSAWHEFIGTGAPAVGPVTWSNGIPAGDNLFEFVAPIGTPVTIDAIIYAEPASDGS